jgi:hypothetical protein
MTEIPELTGQHFAKAISSCRRHPEGPAIALLRIAARHPRILRENLESAA